MSNSMTELYIMQQYLRPSALRRQGLQNFDDWACTFGEVVTQFEPMPDGTDYRPKKRFAKFANLFKLMQMYKEFADMLDLPIPEIKDGKLTAANPNAVYTCVSFGEASCPREIAEHSIDIYEDIAKVLGELRH